MNQEERPTGMLLHRTISLLAFGAIVCVCGITGSVIAAGSAAKSPRLALKTTSVSIKSCSSINKAGTVTRGGDLCAFQIPGSASRQLSFSVPVDNKWVDTGVNLSLRLSAPSTVAVTYSGSGAEMCFTPESLGFSFDGTAPSQWRTGEGQTSCEYFPVSWTQVKKLAAGYHTIRVMGAYLGTENSPGAFYLNPDGGGLSLQLTS